jgi:hypothetical protein
MSMLVGLQERPRREEISEASVTPASNRIPTGSSYQVLFEISIVARSDLVQACDIRLAWISIFSVSLSTKGIGCC